MALMSKLRAPKTTLLLPPSKLSTIMPQQSLNGDHHHSFASRQHDSVFAMQPPFSLDLRSSSSSSLDSLPPHTNNPALPSHTTNKHKATIQLSSSSSNNSDEDNSNSEEEEDVKSLKPSQNSKNLRNNMGRATITQRQLRESMLYLKKSPKREQEEPLFIEVATLKAGKSFGELALIKNRPRAATIKCSEACHFAVINKADYTKML